MDDSEIIKEVRELYKSYVEELNVTFKHTYNVPIPYLDIIEEVRAKIKTCKEADIGVYGICLALRSTSHVPYAKDYAHSIINGFGRVYVQSYTNFGYWWFGGTRHLRYLMQQNAAEDYAEYVTMWYDIRILFLTKILNVYGRE